MTKLEFANKFFFQWLFIRLARCEQNYILQFDINSVNMMPDGSASVGGQVKENQVYQWYCIMGFILPLSGWSNDYIYLWKFTKRITSKKLIPNHKP